MHARALTDPDAGSPVVADAQQAISDAGQLADDAHVLADGALADGALAGVGRQVRAVRELFSRPLTPYYLLGGIMALLLLRGLVMVLSTGSIPDLLLGQSRYSDVLQQLSVV